MKLNDAAGAAERERLLALKRYHILDTPMEAQFDDIVALASQICEVPIALISLVDEQRQWFKAKIGIDAQETPREISACQYAIQQPQLTVVPDTLLDERFKTNPLVTGDPHMRFYAGAPLRTPDGYNLGTLCVLDSQPRQLSEQQLLTLETLSKQVVTMLELKRALYEKNTSEQKLTVVSKRYQTLFNSITQGFCIIEMLFDEHGVGSDYRFIEVNPAFEKQTGLSNAKGNRMLELAPDHEKHWFERYGEVAKTGKPLEMVEYAEALNRWFEIYAFRFGEADENKVAVLFTDITSRKQADISLFESKAHLDLMVESAKDYAIISMDREGIISSWNSGAERIFGSKPKATIGKHIETIFTPEDRAAGAVYYELDTALKTGRANDERWHLRENGERFYASGMLATMHDTKGHVNGFIKIARDMTAQQEAQENLMAARNAAEAANIAKTEFLANMSHEIRTPMNAIIGLANILGMSQPLTQKQRDFIKTLQMSADSLLSLINDLLDISKIEARSVELEEIPFSMTQIVQEVASMMAVRVREKGLIFTGEGESVKNRMFLGDPTRLRQIILNLCSNAIKFTDKGGVHVSIICYPNATPGVETVCVTVRDTGIGIAADKRETIFQKFVQADSSINRKYGGTGLGLAITKTLADIMGGTIKVDSVAGEGSVFTVCLPLKAASDLDIQGADGSLPKLLESTVEHKVQPHVLLVEDYAPNVLVATTFLEQFGYRVDVANNGMEAVEMTRASQYVAVLMDVQMHGMNGLEATQIIRAYEMQQNTPRLAIIGMTAHALAGDRERCLGAGMDEYIAKPFNPDELEQLLSRMVTKEKV